MKFLLVLRSTELQIFKEDETGSSHWFSTSNEVKNELNLPRGLLQSPWAPERNPGGFLSQFSSGLAPSRGPESWSDPQTDYSAGIQQGSLCVSPSITPVPTLEPWALLLAFPPKRTVPRFWANRRSRGDGRRPHRDADRAEIEVVRVRDRVTAYAAGRLVSRARRSAGPALA